MPEQVSKSELEACKRQACAIQTCLNKNDYSYDNCTMEINDLKRCCERNGNKSTHCGYAADDPTPDPPQDDIATKGGSGSSYASEHVHK